MKAMGFRASYTDVLFSLCLPHTPFTHTASLRRACADKSSSHTDKQDFGPTHLTAIVTHANKALEACEINTVESFSPLTTYESDLQL